MAAAGVSCCREQGRAQRCFSFFFFFFFIPCRGRETWTWLLLFVLHLFCACTVRLSGLIPIIGVCTLLCSVPSACPCVSLCFVFSFPCLPSSTRETFLALLVLLPSPRPSVLLVCFPRLKQVFFSSLCKLQLPSFFCYGSTD